MSNKNTKAAKDNEHPEELVDSELEEATGGNFEKIKVTLTNSGGKGGTGQRTGKGGDNVSTMDLGSGR